MRRSPATAKPAVVKPGTRRYRDCSATPWATAQGAHSGTSWSEIRRVITARWSQTPRSSGCEMAHKHSQSRLAQSGEIRQPSRTARIAGSLTSFWTASEVTAAVRSAHSAATAVTASQAAASCRSGLSPPSLTPSSSHSGAAVTRPVPAEGWCRYGACGEVLRRGLRCRPVTADPAGTITAPERLTGKSAEPTGAECEKINVAFVPPGTSLCLTAIAARPVAVQPVAEAIRACMKQG
jgi:hypothetical protein